MELTEWVKLIRNATKGYKSTGGMKLKVFANSDHTELEIRSDEVTCHRCNTTKPQWVKVYFNKPQANLSIFQAELLHYLFCMGKTPIDYAGYHNCIAGKRFIENIKEVSV